ncbi:MAG: peroxidase family protein, partial [Thermoleophilaceae bacterium]
LAVRYLLRPAPDTLLGSEPSEQDPEFLSHEVARRLAEGDVRFELCIQRFKDGQSTPIEDTAVAWSERVSPPEPVAVLTISKRDVDVEGEQGINRRVIDGMAFNPWNTTDSFRPLGNLNRARKAAYDASSAHRLGFRWRTDPPLRNVVFAAGARAMFSVLNRYREWHRLPVSLSAMNLAGLRHVLRRSNLLDTEVREAPPPARPVPVLPDETVRVWRTFDGTYNDLSEPTMGAVGAAFGRNLQPDYRPDLFEEPNPIVVSQQLLFRKTFLPARSLNLLAAAWIQFQVHDWVNHARHPLGKKDVRVPLPPGMAGWSNTPGGPLEPEMRIAGNVSLGEDRADGLQRLFANSASHWWDGSEVYGADSVKARELRDGTKLRLSPEGYLPEDTKGFEITGFNESWWLGLSGLHTLFAREHNLLCDELRTHYRGWSDEQVYQTARLIVSALIAKIHSVEWTPAILATETLDLGMNANWNGLPANDWVARFGIWLLDEHSSVGITSTLPDHHGAPFSLTEDFVTVYRMHPLLPDDYSFYDYRTGELLGQRRFLEIQGDQADDEMRALGLHTMLYSFGISHPGAITLHNYPRSLQAFERNGE